MSSPRVTADEQDDGDRSKPVKVDGSSGMIDTKRVIQGSTMLDIHSMPSIEELEDTQVGVNRSSSSSSKGNSNMLSVPGSKQAKSKSEQSLSRNNSFQSNNSNRCSDDGSAVSTENSGGRVSGLPEAGS